MQRNNRIHLSQRIITIFKIVFGLIFLLVSIFLIGLICNVPNSGNRGPQIGLAVSDYKAMYNLQVNMKYDDKGFAVISFSVSEKYDNDIDLFILVDCSSQNDYFSWVIEDDFINYVKVDDQTLGATNITECDKAQKSIFKVKVKKGAESGDLKILYNKGYVLDEYAIKKLVFSPNIYPIMSHITGQDVFNITSKYLPDDGESLTESEKEAIAESVYSETFSSMKLYGKPWYPALPHICASFMITDNLSENKYSISNVTPSIYQRHDSEILWESDGAFLSTIVFKNKTGQVILNMLLILCSGIAGYFLTGIICNHFSYANVKSTNRKYTNRKRRHVSSSKKKRTRKKGK